MKIRGLRTPLVLLALIGMSVVALRAADDKAKIKDSDVPPPGTIKFASAPAPVQKLFKDQTKNARIDLLGKGTNEDKTSFYKAIVPINGYDYVVAVHEDGTLLEKILNASRTEELKEADCPPAVQKAIREDSKTAKVEGIARVTAGKRSDFFVEVMDGKNAYQLIFTEEGVLTSKMLMEDDNEHPAEPQKKNDPKKISDKPAKPNGPQRK